MYKEEAFRKTSLEELAKKISEMVDESAILHNESNKVYFLTNNNILSNKLSLLLMNIRTGFTVNYLESKKVVVIEADKYSEKIIKNFIEREVV